MITARFLSMLLALLLMLAGVACKGKHNRAAIQNEEEEAAPRVLSTVRMNDAKAGTQLLSGFYGIEAGAWRWTAGRFSVLLRTPPDAAQRGATLTFAFTIPESSMQKLKNMTLSASIDGTALKSVEYKASGSYVFSADVPASMLATESVKVDFALDKSMAPDVDRRELGVVANSVGIVSK